MLPTPSKKTIGTAAAATSILALWTYLAPVVSKALEMRDEWTKLHWRVDNAENRLERLERRNLYLHGRETTEEAKAEAKH